MQKRKGFTLIELLVVVGIIGLLATLAVVAFGSARQKARDSKRVADVRTIVSAFAAASQDNANNTLCSGNAPMGGEAKRVSTLKISSSNACGDDITSTYVNLGSIKDPSYADLCGAFPPVANCDYTVAPNGTLSSFTIGFTTERNDVPGLAASNFHTANQSGIVQ